MLCLISAGQFVVRGALVGLDRMDRYALVMVLDTLLRVAFAGAVALLIDDPGSSTFAWTLRRGRRVAHAPQLYLLATRRVRLGTVPAMGEHTVTVGKVRRAVAPLLLGSLCAQVLLNGPPVLIPALATNEAEITRAGQFIAAFTLARVPLFLVVPLQTALLPSLTACCTRATGRRCAASCCTSVGIAGLGVAALVLGYFAGPPLVGLIFGKSYVLGGRDVALLAVGVAGTSGSSSSRRCSWPSVRHRLVAWSWLSGVAVAAVILFTVPDLLLAAELAFLAVGDGLAGRDTAGPDHRTTRARTAACLTLSGQRPRSGDRPDLLLPVRLGPDQHGARHR